MSDGGDKYWPSTRISRRVDSIIRVVGELSSWLWLVLMFVIVLNVVLRYAFGEGRVEFEELQWHLYAAGFLLALSYADLHDSHVRVDVLHERWSARTQAWIELYGLLLLFFPFVVFMILHAVPFVLAAWQLNEISQAPGGLPMRWLIKAALPLGFLLLAAAGIARLSRVWAFLFGREDATGR